MKENISEKDLKRIVWAVAENEKVFFECLRAKSENVEGYVGLTDELSVVKEYCQSRLDRERIKRSLGERNIHILGSFRVHYNYEKNQLTSSFDVEDDLDKKASLINMKMDKASTLNKVEKRLSPSDRRLLLMARTFAEEAHNNQVRLDGTPYINHPIRVAENVRRYCEKNLKIETLIAAYLHDVVEDTGVSLSQLIAIFGKKVGSLVLEVTNDDIMKRKLGKAVYLTDKMLKMSDEGLILKLCDRLDNVSDLDTAAEKFRKRYSKETLEILENVIELRGLNLIHLLIMQDIVYCLSILKDLEVGEKERVKKLRIKVISMQKQSYVGS